ncbi:T9SS type A sorting domain-containing protein [Chitinophagaceae bacterium 26-R-25]|nr:T9SS type A sorting domain-containing protein [Chitinophagaceae bacterium 26-R-25]
MFTLYKKNIDTLLFVNRCYKVKLICKNIATFLLAALLLYSSQGLAQLAPVYPPAGGFRIDGGLKANTPVVGEGDWVPGPAGSGGFVLSAGGVPVNANTTGLKRDLFNDGNDNIFTNGSKFNDTIGSLHWFPSSAPNKNDINNAMYHVSKDTSNNNQWIIIGGDRLATNGTSYIDFEFLQNTLVRNANGTFTGGGPAGGRTINDLVISMEYTNGGVAANVYFYQWKALGGGNYGFVQFTPPAGTAFALTNGVNEDVPFGAFGSNVYQPFAFVEAAINITKLLASTGDACAGLSVKTLWVKTKASNVTTAALKDFVDPIPVSFTFGSASISYAGPFCAKGTASVTETGIAGGTFSASPAGLSIDPNSGQIDLGASSPNTYTITYTFNSGNGCIKTATATIVINPFPNCSITGSDGPLCPGSTGNIYNATGGTIYKWTISGNGTIVGSDSSNSVSVTAGTNCNAKFTLSLTTTNASGCSSTCNKDVTVKDTIAPVITCPGNKQLLCSAPSDTSKTGVATAIDGCGKVTITYTDSATAAGCSGKAGIDRKWKATDACGNFSMCVQHITFIDTIAPSITCPGDKQLTCGGLSDTTHTGTATAVDNCGGAVTISHTDAATAASCNGIPGIDRTWRATDACGNFSTCVQHITFIDTIAPTITCPAPITVQCAGDVPNPDTTKVTATDNCGSVTRTWVKDDVSGSCPKIITRTYKATDACGNSATCTQTITVQDITPPTIACVSDVKVECGAATDTASTGIPVATDNCGKPTLTHNDVTSSKNCYSVITRTWTATDGCGNTATCVQHITVTDRTGPLVTCPADKVLSCGQSTDPSNTGMATATDNCSSGIDINIFYTDAPAAGSACAGSTNIDRTWTAIDASGNVGTCVQHITFVQNVAPQPLSSTAVKETTQPSTQNSTPNQVNKNNLNTDVSGLQIKAYPNPFQGKVNFRIVSATSGKAVLEVYNILGQRLAIIYEGKVDAGVPMDVNYLLPSSKDAMLIYKLSIGGKTTTGKIQSIK